MVPDRESRLVPESPLALVQALVLQPVSKSIPESALAPASDHSARVAHTRSRASSELSPESAEQPFVVRKK